ncbi:hypothetical protein DAPPUDRAFT_300753 [Daphnia pulex]|uniref:Uncharacterized protein n=1 Tax=Daphnia pulex TaxID=6669 RepID=E9G661_DAPPU|nr:hypothetical protein DAPPUDRAFT_300753 [Daphnia pulex]|eukprot:EFX84880.1 hypothetical protein DAPPUDRAFT_300753 [Daphnia pulex]
MDARRPIIVYFTFFYGYLFQIGPRTFCFWMGSFFFFLRFSVVGFLYNHFVCFFLFSSNWPYFFFHIYYLGIVDPIRGFACQAHTVFPRFFCCVFVLF